MPIVREIPNHYGYFADEPKVNAVNPWSLSSATHEGNACGSSCREEREKKFNGMCGMDGFLWEPKL